MSAMKDFELDTQIVTTRTPAVGGRITDVRITDQHITDVRITDQHITDVRITD